MCGIIGAFNDKNAVSIVKSGLKVMENRGKDASKIQKISSGVLGHNLHAIVDLVKQPIEFNGNYIVANCEIYNWKKLDDKYKLNSKNDAEMLLKLISKKGINKIKQVIDEIDGVFAFCYYDKLGKLILARDIIGVKPIWYSFCDSFCFASEKKALVANNIYDAIELNPRKIIEYDISKGKIKYLNIDFFRIVPEHKKKGILIQSNVKKLLIESVKKRVTDKKIGVLFSGGIDSLMIAFILKKLKVDFTCYTACLDEKGFSTAEDLIYAKKAAKIFGFKLKVAKINLKSTERYIKKIIPLIESTNVVKVGVALPFYLASEVAKKDGVKVLFSGLGSEEIFAGYERHKKSRNINEECLSGLLKMYERDLYRDDVVTMANCIELRLPFLDKKLVEFSLKIPEKYKINNGQTKIILRQIASEFNILDEFAQRKKKAAQYGSKFDRAIQKLAKRKGFKFKSDYLNGFSKEYNLNLGVMFSGGKDSCYAAYLMQKHNYNLKCLLTMASDNKDSYMFHTPNINLAGLQANAMDIPIIVQKTKGEKEIELKDLEKLLIKAKKKYNIDGIISGALFSSYQRERFEKIADKLGLKVFSPLWHKNQEELLREIINDGFKFILVSIAADGLDSSWLGREITLSDVDRLVEINKKIGMNIAFEGGEAETMMIAGPLFKKELVIKKAKKIMENEITGVYVIEKVVVK